MGKQSKAIRACPRLASLMVVALTLSTASPAMSNGYPERGKLITIVVPYPAGGPGDIMVRALTEVLRTELNANFVIENKPGASQILATRAVARAAPDGYTLLLGSATSFALNPITKKSLPYDPVRDFEPISLVINTPSGKGSVTFTPGSRTTTFPPIIPSDSMQAHASAKSRWR